MEQELTYGKNFKAEYKALFDVVQILPWAKFYVDKAIDYMVANEERYKAVEYITAVPWYFIAMLHNQEAGGKFTGHLHNGDPLTARTTHVPAGRPVEGNPPFTWEQSATDAMKYMGYDKNTDWSIEKMLYLAEKYNGFGYRKRNIATPYLWSGSQHYIKGRYVADGKFDSEAVSKNVGVGLILAQMINRHLITRIA